MKIKIRYPREMKNSIVMLGLFILLGISIFSSIFVVPVSVFAGNTSNVTVSTSVNINGTPVDLYLVKIEGPFDSNENIDLEAGNVTDVICNGTFRDLDEYDDVVEVYATLYRTNIASDASDDNNNHYTNLSCESSCMVTPGTNNENGSCTCQFVVQYYAEPGQWQCNMTVNDSGTLSDSLNSSYYNLNEILGIGVETNVINFGNMIATQTSSPVRQNVTNFGNIPLNVTVRGHGGDNETEGHSHLMTCRDGSLNLTMGNMKIATANNTNFQSTQNVTNETALIFNLTIPQRITDEGYGNSSNATFFRLQVPFGADGLCNGTMIFGAVDAS